MSALRLWYSCHTKTQGCDSDAGVSTDPSERQSFPVPQSECGTKAGNWKKGQEEEIMAIATINPVNGE
ncbi:MAG: hypothetical protein ACREDR_36300, partial [Blastocatellia bacterium]